MTDVDAECRAAVSELATAVVLRDPAALSYLSGQGAPGGALPASQMMLSSAFLVADVLGSGVATAAGRQPTDQEIQQAWQQTARQARERLASSLEDLARAQIRDGRPEPEVRKETGFSARTMDAGLVTALPLLTAFISRDMAEFRRGAASAANRQKLTPAVLATQLIIRDLFETAVNTKLGGAASDDQVRRAWETFMAQRAASTRRY
jgi:hypothetical protein